MTTLLTFLSLLGTVPPASDPAYNVGEGSLRVTGANFTIHDLKRNKDLPVVAYFPNEQGSYPVIVFSHGATASGRSYASLLQFWASHGYVCLAPTHDDSLSLHPEQTRRLGVLAAAREQLGQLFHDPPGWKNRTADISFVIDSLPEIPKQVPDLEGKLDGAHIGIGGHSYGAYTTNLIAGALV